MLLAKIALGFAGTVAAAGVYTFHQGVIRVDVDEHRSGGSHVHFWVPATVVPAALHLVPNNRVEEQLAKAGPMLPTVRTLIAALADYPDAEFVDVKDGEEHVRVGTRNGKVQIDVTSREETVHVAVPIATMDSVIEILQSKAPQS